ncbi:MAG TPA: alpha-hydroxy acid oxidase [Vicinamibacterales bacterium]|nr:alpha-hydroxy acid oxidase [Vicinamibacterales bacterium]
MEPAAWDYYAGAAGDERTLADNVEALGRLKLVPRVLVDVSRVDTSTTVLGEPLSMPIMLAPTAFNKLAHPEGEAAAARAAAGAGTLMVASTIATCTLEEIASAAPGPRWFQLYIYKDRAITAELVARAEAAGYRAIVLTVDTPLLGRRERDARNNFMLPPGIGIANFAGLRDRLDATGWPPGSSFSAYVHNLFDASVTWEALDWLRASTTLPVVLKGVLSPDDAMRAVEAGAAGVIVSNHGGRQLDGAIASIDALPAVAEAVGGRIEVLMDGGIRRGADVIKALALGARAVLIGRPYLWGLAANGEQGVRHVLDILRGELELAMALAGRPTPADIDRSAIAARSAGEHGGPGALSR